MAVRAGNALARCGQLAWLVNGNGPRRYAQRGLDTVATVAGCAAILRKKVASKRDIGTATVRHHAVAESGQRRALNQDPPRAA